MPPQTLAFSTSSVIWEKALNVRVIPNGAGKVTLTLTSSRSLQHGFGSTREHRMGGRVVWMRGRNQQWLPRPVPFEGGNVKTRGGTDGRDGTPVRAAVLLP